MVELPQRTRNEVQLHYIDRRIFFLNHIQPSIDIFILKTVELIYSIVYTQLTAQKLR